MSPVGGGLADLVLLPYNVTFEAFNYPK